jgi:hypothetical protein
VALTGSGKAASTHIPEFRYTHPDAELDAFDFPPPQSPFVVDLVVGSLFRNDQASKQSALITLSGVPRSPSSSKHPAVQFFLKYHQACVVPYHYFRSYDYHETHLKLVPSMAENSTCLSYAISAFSAMVYSAQVNIAAREVAFYLYSMALKELFAELERVENDENLDKLVATALELAVTDVMSHANNFDSSDFTEKRLNVPGTSRVSLVFCRNILLPPSNVPQFLDGVCSNGIAGTKIGRVRYWVFDIRCRPPGEQKTFGLDTLREYAIPTWASKSENFAYWTKYGRN